MAQFDIALTAIESEWTMPKNWFFKAIDRLEQLRGWGDLPSKISK